MKELKVKNNDTGFVIYINGIPNLKIIPEDMQRYAVSSLEITMSKYFNNRTHNKKFWHKNLTTFLDKKRQETTILVHQFWGLEKFFEKWKIFDIKTWQQIFVIL